MPTSSSSSWTSGPTCCSRRSRRFPERIRDFGGDCFAAIRQKDIVVHHPYESFDVVVQFLRQAARDPDVVAIKQTLYRTARQRRSCGADRGGGGRQVGHRAGRAQGALRRGGNIQWARDLERAGAQVVYGFIDLKTHAKVSLVVRREARACAPTSISAPATTIRSPRRSTPTSRFFTCDPALGRDAARLFNYVTGYARPEGLEKLAIAPLTLRAAGCSSMIDRGDRLRPRRAGRRRIWVKLNSLVDPEVIDALYAREPGRGADRPGGPRHLLPAARRAGPVGEHPGQEHRRPLPRARRIVCFGNGHGLPSPEARVFISSADWMPRNLDRRIETLVPIENPTVHQQILDQIMVANLKDEAQSWELQADGGASPARSARTPSARTRYFMTNPSLSGRGSAAQGHGIPPVMLQSR